MPIQNYNTAEARLGKYKGALLKRAIPQESLAITGNMRQMPKNNSDTVIFRRWLPTGATASDPNNWNVNAAQHQTQEGVTPTAETITPQDIPVTLTQYSCLYMYTDKTADLYEDDVPAEMIDITGERMGLVREMVRYGTLKGCTNKFYAGGTSRGTVDAVITLNMMRKVARSLLGNRGKVITKTVEAGTKYNTAPCAPAFLVFVHTDAENDIKNIPGFVETHEYGTKNTVHDNEIGSVDRFRFIVSPELHSITNSGAAVGTTGLYSSGGSNIDVYPFIVVAEDAWADVALRGAKSLEPTHIPARKKTKDDPHGQRGYVGSIFWCAPFIQNDFWMAVVEAGVTDL